MAKFEKRAFKFETPDHFNIAADFYLEPSTKDVPQPCVVLVHQFNHSKEQWDTFPEEVMALGSKVVSYDIRGHGASDKVKDMPSLLSDPQQAPFDFEGLLNWMSGARGIDPEKVAVVGTSIGGYVACMANALYPKNVRTAVAISSSKEGVLSFLRHKPGEHRMRSVLYIAARGDGSNASDAGELAKSYTDEPKEVKIYEDVSGHGANLMNEKPEIKGVIIDWLKRNLK